MKQNSRISKAVLRGESVHPYLPLRQDKESDSPVAVETFERERMGVAAKE